MRTSAAGRVSRNHGYSMLTYASTSHWVRKRTDGLQGSPCISLFCVHTWGYLMMQVWFENFENEN